MVHFITLYSFLIRKEKNIHRKLCLTINNWKQGIYQDEYNGVVGYYKNDKLHGPCYGIYYDWYNNGQLWVKGYYKNDKLHDPWYHWYDNGQLCIKGYYKNDELHGPLYRWHDNGQLCIKCYYKNDKLHGKYYEWDKNGNLIENSTWDNGIKIEN